MQVTAEQADPCTVVLDISIDEDQVARAFEVSWKEFGKYANVPGFRPGKAPRVIVQKYVDIERVRKHTMEKLVRESYPQAVDEQGIEPYSDPKIDPTDLEDKKTFTYKATIPLAPSVTIGEYTGFTIEKPVFPVTEEMVNNQLEQMRQEAARLERVTGRAVEAGDVLIAETKVVLEGDEDDTPPKRQLIYLQNNVPGYDEQIIGMEVGEEKSFDLTYPDDYYDEVRRGKSANYYVKLSSMSAKKLPDLDDEFAMSVAKLETVDALKEAINRQLESEAARISNEIAEQRIIEKIVDGSQIYFPDVMVRSDVEQRFRRLSAELQSNNISYNTYLARAGLTQEQHQSNVFVEAETQIRSVLALRMVAAQELIDASEDQINSEFARLLATESITREQHDEFYQDPDRRFQVKNALVQQGLHDFLFGNNTIVEVESTEEEAEVSAE